MSDLEQLILERYTTPEWVSLIEVRAGTGYGGKAEQRYDAVALNCWPSSGHRRVVFEVKRSRSDFMKELSDPLKRKQAEDYFHETWFVCLPDVCDVSEVPEGWGLLVSTKKGDKLRQKRAAMQRAKPKDPKVSFYMSMLRQQQQINDELDFRIRQRITAQFGGKEVTEDDLQAIAKDRTKHEREKVRVLEEKAENKYKEAADIRINLVDPLKHLAKLCGRFSVAVNGSLTREHVDALVNEAVHRKMLGATDLIKDTHATLGALIKGLENGG